MKKNNKKGFTLVELVIVVAVMAILVAIAIPTVSAITEKATNAVKDTNAQTIESMLKLKMADTNVASLSKDAVADALVDAKLGITKDTYYYTVATGSVGTTGTASAESGKEVYSIAFSATQVTVSDGAAASNVVKNLDGSAVTP